MQTGKSFVRASIKLVNFDESSAAILRVASPAQRKIAIEAGAIAAGYAIRNYYASRGRNMWLNLALPTHGAGRKPTQWWRSVANGWTDSPATSTSVTFSNSTLGLAHKITGGTISAKRKRFLTIPIDPRAHGLSAKNFSVNVLPLFRIKNALMATEKDGTLTPIYALKKSITQKPWPGALPPEQSYVDPFIDEALESLERQFLA